MQTGNGSASSLGPVNLGHRRRLLRAEAVMALAVHCRTADRPAAGPRRLCVATAVSRTAQRWRMSASAADAGLRTHHLLKDQHVAHLQIRRRSEQRGLGGALRQAAVGVAPGVELHLVVLRKEVRVLHRLEHHDAGIERSLSLPAVRLRARRACQARRCRSGFRSVLQRRSSRRRQPGSRRAHCIRR